MTDYNGWSNRETWNVNLWLSNDEPMYRDVNRLEARALIGNTRAEAVEELAEAVERYVRDEAAGVGFGDLSAADLAAVDWSEIADAWIDTDEPEVPEMPAMMPGQVPYTPEEYARVRELVRDAAEGDPGEQGEEVAR